MKAISNDMHTNAQRTVLKASARNQKVTSKCKPQRTIKQRRHADAPITSVKVQNQQHWLRTLCSWAAHERSCTSLANTANPAETLQLNQQLNKRKKVMTGDKQKKFRWCRNKEASLPAHLARCLVLHHRWGRHLHQTVAYANYGQVRISKHNSN